MQNSKMRWILHDTNSSKHANSRSVDDLNPLLWSCLGSSFGQGLVIVSLYRITCFQYELAVFQVLHECQVVVLPDR